MTYERIHASFVGVLATLSGSIVVAEFAGYWLRRLLHSDRFPSLSRHRSVNSEGFMDANFGIGFYSFDRFFRTMARRHRPFNWTGYRRAIQRHGLDKTELVSLRRCSEALFHKADKPSGRPQEQNPLPPPRR